MTKSFEIYLEKKCLKDDYFGSKDGFSDYFDNWLCNRQPDEWIKYAEEYAKESAPINPVVARKKLDCINKLREALVLISGTSTDDAAVFFAEQALKEESEK